jgi:transcriptional regulator ATRX
MFLGNIYEFNNLYANPIKQGQHIDSDIHDIKLMKERSYILNSVLSAFIHRRNVSLLKTFLPKKFEYCIYVGLTENQTNLYKHYLSTHPLRNETFLMPDWTALRKIWTHVRILKTSFEKALIVDRKDIEKKRLKKQYAKDLGQSVGFDDDEDERLEDSDENGDDSDENLALNNNPFSGNWWRGMIPDAEFESLFASNKLVILFEIIKKCQDRGEKLVVFSSFVMVLETLEYEFSLKIYILKFYIFFLFNQVLFG